MRLAAYVLSILALSVFMPSSARSSSDDLPSPDGPPAMFHECERLAARVGCGTWTRTDTGYSATWDTGATTSFALQRWDRREIVFTGLTPSSIYTGHVDSNGTASGDVVYFVPRRYPQYQLGKWRIASTATAADINARSAASSTPAASIAAAKDRQQRTCEASLQDKPTTDAFEQWQAGYKLFADGDLEDAIIPLCRSFAKGYAHAAFTIGQMYDSGFRGVMPIDRTTGAAGITQSDTSQAFVWYQDAARRNFSRAINMIAYYYINGPDIPGSVVATNVKHGVALNVIAGETLGDTEALADLVSAFDHGLTRQGQSIPANRARALKDRALALEGLLSNQSSCVANLPEMRSLLPDRKITGVFVSAVSYDADSDRMEVSCDATLAVDEDASNDVLAGGVSNDWHFLVTSYPDGRHTLIQRDSSLQTFASFEDDVRKALAHAKQRSR